MKNIYLKAGGLGILAGMRSMAAPALTGSHFVSHPSPALARSPLRVLALPGTARVLQWLALGELGGDKLPKTPNRTDPGPLGARAVSGGLCGAAVFVAAGERAAAGAAVGALAAVGSSFAFYWLRRSLGQATKIPDFALAAAEDALAVGLGRQIFAE